LERYFTERKGSERAPGLYLPEPGVANAWPVLRSSAEVEMNACYAVDYETPTHSSGGVGWVTFCTRFSRESLDGGYKNLNAHLLDTPPPASWKLCKQFGDEYYRRSKKPKGKQVRKRGAAKKEETILSSISNAL